MDYDYHNDRHTPEELSMIFAEKGWNKVVAFQTRNPLHKAHVEMTLRATKGLDANLLIHPVVGMTKPGDVDHYTRVRCYNHALKKYPENMALISLLPLAMRMGGPREALWHALIRKNYGCTHLVVGRDHAGPGNNKNGKPFYGSFDAQELLLKYQEEIGIEMVPFKFMVYLPKDKCYEEFDEIKDGVEFQTISGSELRERLDKGKGVPEWFTYPEVANELEAYGLNIRSDPRFLILKFPYFADVVTTFFLPKFPNILENFFARPIRDDLNIPKEVQWFLMPFDEKDLKQIKEQIKNMEPILKEEERLNHQFPIEAAYLGEQTRDKSLLIDIAAAKLLKLPDLKELDREREEAFSILEQQFDKLDNTQLGYKVDRKREALMLLTYKMNIKNPKHRLGLYFHFLKNRYIGEDGEVHLKINDEEDLRKFVEEKHSQVNRMIKSKNFTEIERQGAKKMIKATKR